MVSRRLLKRPIIKLIRQNTAGPLISQKQDPSVEVQTPVGADVTPQYVSPSRSSKTRKPEVQELDRSPVKGEVKRKKRLPVTPLTTKSGVVGQDSAGLPKSPDTPNTTPKGKPLSIKKKKKRGRYQCQIWHRYLSGKDGLKVHNMIHTGERPFKCSMCDRSFRRRSHLLNHELCHWDEPSGSIAGHSTGGSVSCSTSGSSQGNEERLLKCRVCPAVFSSVLSLKAHLTIHDPSRPFPCTICGMKCKTSGNMRQHMRAHTATPNLCCPYCDKRFHRTSYFEEHLQHHKNWDAESTEEARNVCKSSVSESRSPTDHFELDLESDSDSDCEVISGVASADTPTEGEEVDESNGTAGGRTAEYDGLLEKAGEIGSCEKSDKKEESSDGGDTMRPVCSDDESEQEEGEKDKELIALFANPVQRSGPHYRNPRCEYNRRRGRDPQYKCEWCGHMYMSQHGLKRHYEVHKQVPHPCKCCGKVFMSVRYLRIHLRSSGM